MEDLVTSVRVSRNSKRADERDHPLHPARTLKFSGACPLQFLKPQKPIGFENAGSVRTFRHEPWISQRACGCWIEI
ncbi:hypothetical protein G7K_5229-t1 [Saitoella complicata NRRL Y-17804]|uniref:Uncharacterized protein n=1 Tax=Saitoella complicata (strain BCRC 22490 / CBS 7301 / JCM 7358 / NBRC 10748 / NRRL Y-17804) TaxID=698492 RepID=A0A0E9NMU0_SAICN|nr:hypothetical protein G7K_5229-t1 [Saitoella complicata NRRL Y-17804]